MLTENKAVINSGDTPSVAAQTVITTLAVDIGGSGTKVILLDQLGEPISERARVKTPSPATPKAVMGAIAKLAADQPTFDRVSVGFQALSVRALPTLLLIYIGDWVGFPLAEQLTQTLQRPTRVANDADLQGFGAVSGNGVELVITLGTGFGSALFVNGHLVPNLEMAHHRFRKTESYEEQLGRAALEKVGKEKWNRRLKKAIAALDHLFNFDHLYIGGGETKNINFKLASNVSVVPNVLGLLGGIALWRESEGVGNSKGIS